MKSVEELKDCLTQAYKTNQLNKLIKLFLKDKIQLSIQDKFVRLCYLEGSSNWTEYSRYSRNTFWYFNDITDECEIIRMGMERGAEIIRPKVQTTQDVKNGSIEHFDENQKGIMSAFMGQSDLPNSTILSFKADGCCLKAAFYPISDPVVPFIRSNLIGREDLSIKEFFEIVEDEVKKVNSEWFPVFGTNGSLFAGSDMISTWVQSLAGTAGIEISAEKSWQITLREALPIVFPKMFSLIEKITEGRIERINLIFEGVLSNRKDVWGTTFHTELVVNYSWSGLVYLGASYGYGKSVGIYRPHFEDDEIVHLLGFKQPIFFKIEKSSQKAEEMLEDLDLLLKNEISKSRFFEKHPASNTNFSNQENDWVVDYEGFVVLDYLPSGRWHYNKLKTGLYYKLHKLRYSNFAEILQLPLSVSDIMPNLKVAHVINNAMAKLNEIPSKIEEIMVDFQPVSFETSIVKNSIFATELNKATNEKHLESVKRKMEGLVNAYRMAYEEKTANQLDIGIHNSDVLTSVFNTFFITQFGFKPKNAKHLKDVIMMLNPRKNNSIDECRRELFYGFADAISKN